MEWRVWIIWGIIFCIRYSGIFWVYHQKHEVVTDNPPIRTCQDKIENRIKFKIKAGF